MPSFMCNALAAGCPQGARYLPEGFPHWKTVYSCFWRWQRKGVWDTVLVALQGQVRVTQGRPASPTVAVIDSQSSKTTEPGTPWVEGRVALMAPKV